MRNRSNCSRHVACRWGQGPQSKWGEGGGARVWQPTRPLNRCKIFDSELATVQWGEERCSLLERGGGGGCVSQWMECSAMLGPLFPLTFFVSPNQCVDRVPKVGLWKGHWGRRQRRNGTSCELFHIWAIINHGLRLG